MGGVPFTNVGPAVHMQHFPGDLTGFGQVNHRVHDILDFWNPAYRLKCPYKVLPLILVRGSVDNTRSDGIYPYALLDVFHRQAPGDGFEAAFSEHGYRNVDSRDRMTRHRRRDGDDASAGALEQHLLDGELRDE